MLIFENGNQDGCDVVFAAARFCFIDQFFDFGFKILSRLQNFQNIFIADKAVKPVGAEEEKVSGLGGKRKDIGIDNVLHADSPGHNIFKLHGEFFFDPGIFGFLNQ